MTIDFSSHNSLITEYVTGCAMCQQNKNITHRKRSPLYRIPTPEDALPFQQTALDLITGLPPNGPHNSVLTIVDHGCSRAAVFLPCATTITGCHRQDRSPAKAGS